MRLGGRHMLVSYLVPVRGTGIGIGKKCVNLSMQSFVAERVWSTLPLPESELTFIFNLGT